MRNPAPQKLAAAKARFQDGMALLRQGRAEDAARQFEAALRAVPDFAPAHARLGAARMMLGAEAPAIRHLQRAVALAPGDADNHKLLGWALGNAHRLDEAVKAYDAALKLAPDDRDARVAKAVALERRGDGDAAYTLLRPLVDEGAANFDLAYAFAAVSRHDPARRAEAAALIERVLGGAAPLSPVQRQGLHFVAGEVLDKQGDYDRAFAHYRQGNELGRRPYDAEDFRRRVDAYVAAFDAAAMARLPRATNRSGLPVFIVGMPRSGTSLAEQVLAAHPRVHAMGEQPFIRDLAYGLPKLLGGAYPACIAALTGAQADRLAEGHLARLKAAGPGSLRVTDKMPQNFLSLGLIALLFPGARVVHCRRDPLDTCLSCYFQNFSAGHAYTFDLEALGRYHVQYQRLMRHWEQVLDLPLLHLDYESMATDPEPAIRRLVDFCGLEWDPACLDFHRSGRVVQTASYDQVRQPVYTASVARWKRYDAHLGPLKAALFLGR